MKKILLFNLICFCGSILSAQEMNRIALPKETYSNSKKTITTYLERKVDDAFKNIDASYVLDFTNAQSKNNISKMAASISTKLSHAEFIDYTNTKTISELLQKSPEALTVKLPFKGSILTIDLVKSNLFTDDFKVITNDGKKIDNNLLGVYYQGVVRGEKSVAGFSFFEGEFTALIASSEEKTGTIEAGSLSSGTAGTHIIYADKDLKVGLNSKLCSSETMPGYKNSLESMKTNINEKPQRDIVKTVGEPLKCVTFFWEASYSFYRNFQDSFVSSAETKARIYITSLFNNFMIVYNNENIGVRLDGIKVWITPDPYGDNYLTFCSLRRNFGANLAMLLSANKSATPGLEGTSGLGYVDSICDVDDEKRHSFCGNVFGYGSLQAFPSFSWPVYLTTHEVGHNLGSPHTQSCFWNGNNSAIDGCAAAEGYPNPYIVTCSNGPIPSSNIQGTIMSYCSYNRPNYDSIDLANSGYILLNGFGPQPGNLIRGKVNSCISLTCGVSSCLSKIRITSPIITGNVKYEASNDILGAALVNPGIGSVRFDAGSRIILAPGFQTKMVNGSGFYAYIDGCGGLQKNDNNNNPDDTAVANDFANEKKFSVYPNPADNVLNISMVSKSESIKSIVLYDVLGRLLKFNLINNPSTIDITSLMKGNYIVKVTTTNNKEYSTQFIKN
jgi:Secretion system C-terminal sorting domain/Metallo-peptidase family M12